MQHPLAVIGAGPIGLAAAAHAVERGLDVVVLEAGSMPGAAVEEWAHVRLFSAWRELVDPAARRLLEATGTWETVDDAAYPTGAEWRRGYLEPLADALAALPTATLRYDARVAGVSRSGRDLVVDSGREEAPFCLHLETPHGPERLLADAVIDASGTWRTPNPLGADGYPALGETEHADRITYGLPDLTDPATAVAVRRQARRGRGSWRVGPRCPHRSRPARRAGRRHPGVVAAASQRSRGRVRRRRRRRARAAWGVGAARPGSGSR